MTSTFLKSCGRGILVLSVAVAIALSQGAATAGMMGGGGMGGSGMGCGCGGGMGGGGGSTVVDPPIGAVLVDPPTMPDLNPDPNIVEVNLEARIAPVNVNGVTANLMTYNGCYPGPTIRVRKGNILRIHMKNSLPATNATNFLGFKKNLTNLHTHGWHVSPKAPSDFMMYELNPGETYNHEYDTSLQEAGTLSLYHPHKHGLVAEQYWAGLMGCLVVEDETPALANFETHILVLKDITISNGSPAPHSSMMDYMNGKEGDVVMVDGQVNPRLYVKAGQVQRWRIVNASNARFYKLSLEGHTMQLIGTDGGLVDKPYPQSEILLSPAERVDVLVKATQTSGNYRLRAMPYSRMGMMSSPTITLMTMTYKGSLAQTVPSVINPSAKRLDPNTIDPMMRGPARTITLSMGQGRGYINGQDFDVNPFQMMSTTGTYEKWTIINQSGMDHPFHQHVNAAQVLSITGGDPNYAALYTSIPAWKDVVLVPKGGSVTMLVPVMDYDGMIMFHCHILEHEDIGMMGMWNIMSPGMPM